MRAIPRVCHLLPALPLAAVRGFAGLLVDRKLFRDLFIPPGYQYDYVFDWTILKYQRAGADAPRAQRRRAEHSRATKRADKTTEHGRRRDDMAPRAVARAGTRGGGASRSRADRPGLGNPRRRAGRGQRCDFLRTLFASIAEARRRGSWARPVAGVGAAPHKPVSDRPESLLRKTLLRKTLAGGGARREKTPTASRLERRQCHETADPNANSTRRVGPLRRPVAPNESGSRVARFLVTKPCQATKDAARIADFSKSRRRRKKKSR